MTNDFVNGKTVVYGIIGDPVEHTFSPLIHNTCAGVMGINLVYCPFRVEKGSIETAVKGAYALGIRGLNVTVPHKINVMKFLCGAEDTAKHINAVNTLKYTENGYYGYNTDITGLYYALKENGIEIKGGNVLILGAGGAGCAAAAAVASNGAKSLVLANRTVEKAVKLAENISKYYGCDVSPVSINSLDENKSYDIIINATTAGFGEQKEIMPVSEKITANSGAVFDAIYSPWETKLLKKAREFSVKAVNGFDMLVYQAAAAEEIWLDIKLGSDEKRKLKDNIEEYYRKSVVL